MIDCEDLDASQKRSAIMTEVDSEDTTPVVPYEKTIRHMRKLLERTSAPMQKLIDLADNRDILSRELEEF